MTARASSTAALDAAPDDAGVLLPDCVLDPGVAGCGGAAAPVFGLLRTSMGWSVTAGGRAG